MVMAYSLMVYAGIEHKIRNKVTGNRTVLSRYEKENDSETNSTLGVPYLRHLKMEETDIIVGLELHYQQLIEILGPDYASFYS